MGLENEANNVLFMSNHPLVHRTAFGIRELSRSREDLRVVCDAAFATILQKTGLSVIKIDSANKIEWTSDYVDKARVWLTRTWGKMIGAYNGALSKDDAINAMVESLKGGHDLFIAPAGVSKKNAEWRWGVGKVAMALEGTNVRAGFLYIPKSFFEKNTTIVGPTIGSFIPKDGEVNPAIVTAALQQQYNSFYSKSRKPSA